MLFLRGYVFICNSRRDSFFLIKYLLVDLCPKQNNTGSALSKKSHVEDFSEKAPALFNALTAGEDAEGRWTSITFPVDFENLLFAPKKEIKLHLRK